MIVKINRRFLPQKIKITSWDVLEPYYQQLVQREIKSVEALENWLKDRSELEAFVSEDLAWRYVKMTCNTENKDLEKDYLFFVTEIEPKISPYNDRLNRKLVECPYVNDLNQEKYFVYLREVKKDIAIFREENVPILAEIAAESQKYAAITGSLMVELEGKELTLQQAANYLKKTDRALRQLAFETIHNKRLEVSANLDELFDKLIALRHQVALNAGFENFRDYMFTAMGRFDYTPQDCFDFHEAVRKHVVPLVKTLHEKRAQELGYSLRPWDLEVDTQNLPPLEPFTSGADLLDKSISCLRKVDDYFAWCLETMNNMERLDLESRKGKAPGGYNYPMYETHVPFIFMNAASSTRDVETMVHEAGHAVHAFLTKDLELNAFKHCPSEVAELASMSMELLTYDGLDAFYKNPDDLNRAKREHLEGIIKILPWIAIIDKFQHWIYTHPDHTAAQRKQYWLQLQQDFGTGMVDWQGYESFLAYTWQKQLHLFEVPFYYIEYGIAQLGAIAVWRNYQHNKSQALSQYKTALSLGYTKTIKEIYRTAGIEFNFKADYIKELMEFVKINLESLK